ncbi:MAG: hypothetical protein GX335_08980 [Firmicutes bacterium]|nr:hypothetical protein [Bacillota bacterium]
MRLPQERIRWQSELGDAFLQALDKHDLHNFQGKQRYISPILAHGYVPNWHLESYFEDVVLAIYKEREKVDLQVKREEIEHLTASWRNDFAGYEKYQNSVEHLEKEEKKLLNINKAWQHKDLLEVLQDLEGKLLKKAGMEELFAYSDDQLVQLELEQAECKKQYYHLRGQIEEKKRIEILIENQKTALQVLENEIEKTANQIFAKWNCDLTEPILTLPVKKIGVLIEEVETSCRTFSGIAGWFLRFLAPARYKCFRKKRQELEGLLNPFPWKGHLSALPHVLPKLQDLLNKYRSYISSMAEINSAYQEVAFTAKDLVSDRDTLKSKLDRLTQELGGYKTRLVLLGKGNIEVGKELLVEQRKIMKEIKLLRGKIPGDPRALMAFLPMARDYKNKGEIEFQLTKIREKKKEALGNLKVYKNPLYTLNESTRIFILQGGERAVEFIFQSLLLIDILRKDKAAGRIILPDRIKGAMKNWWRQKGKNLLEKVLEERTRDRLVQDQEDIQVRKPLVRFDPVHKEIKVILPRQPVRDKVSTTLSIQGNSGQSQRLDLPLMLEGDIYWSEVAELQLKHPKPLYLLQFICGEKTRSWRIKGVDPNSPCMLFNLQGDLVSGNLLPEGGAYLIAPMDSKVSPIGTITEQLPGYWSSYKYWLIAPEDRDVVVVQTGRCLRVFRRRTQLKPTLIPHELLHGITAGGAPVHRKQLPTLAFTINHPEEIKFHGIRLDSSSSTLYRTLEELNATIDKENLVLVSLADLAVKQNELYKMKLTKRSNIVWSEQFAVFSDLRFSFDQKAYKVQDGQGEIGRLEFNSGYEFEFIPEGSRSEIKSLSPSVVAFDTSQNNIKGRLIYHFLQKQAFEINVEVPAIRWRQEGKEWKTETRELWHEDLGEIEIAVPANIGAFIDLSIEGDKQVLNSTVRQGIATFNLRRFSDTMRDSDEALQEITFSCGNPDIPPFILLRVRTRWQAAKIKLIQSLQEKGRHLVIEWEDYGQASSRVIRLWPLNMPGVDCVVREIPDGINSLHIKAPIELIPPGHYRLQLDIVDPWSSTNPLMPEQDAENCTDVDIGTKEEHLNNYLGKRLKITALYHDEEGAELDTYYWIEVTELNPVFEGEVRLVGNLYSLAEDKSTVAMAYNPVSFYISDCKMPFLIDKDGDGATYCRKCKVMFWEVAHKECGNAVLAPDTIKIKVEE